MPPASSCGKCCMYEHRRCKLAGVKKSSSYVCSDVNNRARLTFIFLLKLQKYRREKYYSQFTQKWKVTVQKVRSHSWERWRPKISPKYFSCAYSVKTRQFQLSFPLELLVRPTGPTYRVGPAWRVSWGAGLGVL